MTEPLTELLNHYQDEVDKCWNIAQKLDTLNPELVGAFEMIKKKILNMITIRTTKMTNINLFNAYSTLLLCWGLAIMLNLVPN